MRSRAASALLAAATLLIPLILAAAPAWGEEAAPVPKAPSEPPAGSSQPDCAEQIAAQVQARYDKVHNIRSRFRQVTRSALLGNASLGDDAPSTGRVQLAKPGKMRWAYEEPQESLVVSNGEVVWIYDPAAREAQRLPVLEGYLTGAALEFLLGSGKLLESFHVSSKTCEVDANGTVELDLVPREPASYERMGMRIELKTGQMVATSLLDIFGNQTLISFSEIEANVEMSDTDFVFSAPEGVSVVELVPANP